MYKSLISHCQSLLSKHHALARGTHKQKPRKSHELGRSLTPTVDSSNDVINDFTEPIVIVDEAAMLQNYWSEYNITAENEKIFLEETLLGCMTLKLFYKHTGGRYLKTEYNVFAVLAFLSLYRLESDLDFATYSKFFKCCNPSKMARFLAFLFDSAHLLDNGILAKAWSSILDLNYIKTTILGPMLKHAKEVKTLIEELIERSEKGMVLKKSGKPKTVAAPFTLTVQNPRKIPEPAFTHSSVTKAQPIPASFYKGTGDFEAIEKAKLENRRRSLK
ncbi:hypothetical protein HK100_004956 [Physocladia obscura]|uniref:Uncharacterized protein n=1 Tax=Physocladia obscura TaxID=109957 RepID=A0AAD5T658_9FUNG|nr:hypothetical protein HK100_004956 [Physocladia obscura]